MGTVVILLGTISITCFLLALRMHLNQKGQVKISVKGNDGWGGNTKKIMSRGRAEAGGMGDIWKPNGWTLSGKMGGHDAIDVRKANRDGIIAGLLISIILIILYTLLFT